MNTPFESEDFDQALSEIGETASQYNAAVVLTDHCLGCGEDEEFSFYNWKEEKYNTVVLDFDNNMEKYLEKSMPNVVILICNSCKASHIEEEILKRNLIRMALEGVVRKFTNDNGEEEGTMYDDIG